LHTWHLETLLRKLPAFKVWLTGRSNMFLVWMVASQKENLLAK
jgi:hypothetical protein